MYGYRGRGGSSRSTPANERHYSYECKVPAQERPYASRPSRSQQLRNPKLAPKLTEDKPPIPDKKGIADEELAKREAGRERKREVEEYEDKLVRSEPRSKRSPSVDSVSTISTKASADSPERRESKSPPPRRGRRNSHSSHGDEVDERRSRSPQQSDRSLSRDSVSPRREGAKASYRSRGTGAPRDSQHQHRIKRRRRHSTESRSPEAHGRVSRSRSPRRRVDDEEVERRHAPRHPRGPDTRSNGRDSGRNGHGTGQKRERSLSPFSQRLAMTRAMQSGGS